MSYNKFDKIPRSEQESSIIKNSGDLRMNDNNSGRDVLMENSSANNSLRFSIEDQNSIGTNKSSAGGIQIIQRHHNKILLVVIGVLVFINLIITCHNRSLINNVYDQVPRSPSSEGQHDSLSDLRSDIIYLKQELGSLKDSLKNFVQRTEFDSTLNSSIRKVESLSTKVEQINRFKQQTQQDIQKVKEDIVKDKGDLDEVNKNLKRIIQNNNEALKKAEEDRATIRATAVNTSQKSLKLEGDLSNLKDKQNNDYTNTQVEIEELKIKVASAQNSAKNVKDDFDDFKYKETQSTVKMNQVIGGLKNTKKEVLSSVYNEKAIQQEFADRVQVILMKVAESLRIDKTSDEYPFIGLSESQNTVIKDLIDANESCLHPQDISSSITECHASSSREPCSKAIDGILKSRTSKSEWTTNGEQNPWITLVFKNKVRVRALKVLQKFDERGAAQRVNVTMNDGYNVVSRFSATSSREWNVIKLPKSVSTDTIKITIIEANWGNNGFKEIKVQGCEACIDNI